MGQKILNVQSRRKRAPGSVILEPNPVFKEMRSLKKGLLTKWNKGSGALMARPHPAKLPSCEMPKESCPKAKESINKNLC